MATKKYLTDIDLKGKLLINGSGGTVNYFLQTDGSGNLTWAAASGGGSLGYIGTTQSTASSGGTSTLTGVNTFTGVNRSTSGSSAITSTNITFKTGDAVGTLFQTPSATSGNISIVSGDVQGDIATSGDVTIGNGALLGYDSEFGSGVAGSVNIGNINTNATNIIAGYGGLIIKNTSSPNSYIRLNSNIGSGVAAPIQIGYNNTVATKVYIGSESTTAKVQLLGVVLHNYAVVTRNTTTTLLYTDLLNGIITNNTGGITLTLPTGANMDNIYNDDSNKGFEWSIISTAASSITIANNSTSHLRVGSGTVAASSSARFMTMRTGLSIWTTYRIS